MMSRKRSRSEETNRSLSFVSVGAAIGLLVFCSHVLCWNSILLPEDTTSGILGGALYDDCYCEYYGPGHGHEGVPEITCYARIPQECETVDDCVGCRDDEHEHRCDVKLETGYDCLELAPHYCRGKTWRDSCLGGYCAGYYHYSSQTSCSLTSPETVKQCTIQ